MNIIYYLPHGNYISASYVPHIVIYSTLTLIFGLSPLAGCLADIKFGRFKTVLATVLAVIVTVFSLMVLLLAHQIANEYKSIIEKVTIFPSIVILVLYMVYDVNVLHFSMDQLQESPADHQGLFLHWYVWLKYLMIFVSRAESCIDDNILDYLCLGNMAVATMLLGTVGMVAHCKQELFLIDVAKINPFKLLYKVTKFSWQHSAPIRRSAFTYCEDEKPSRLELGMEKYGGPFTTEQVEDVKAFYGILLVMSLVAPVYCTEIAMNFNRLSVNRSSSCQFALHHYNLTQQYSSLLTFLLLDNGLLKELLVILLIPFYLIALRPIVLYCLPSMLTRIGLGIFFMMMSLILTFVLHAIFQLKPHTATTCEIEIHFQAQNGAYSMYIENGLKVLRYILSSLFTMTYYIALNEFICSQSPQSMKGILIGLSFTVQGIFQFIGNVGITRLLYIRIKNTSICGAYYYLANMCIIVALLLTFVCIAKKYSLRKRDYVCHVYRFVEEYFSKTQDEPLYDCSASINGYSNN